MFGGKKGVLIADPDITVYNINNKTDYLFMGCDGIFDVINTKELNEYIWSLINQ